MRMPVSEHRPVFLEASVTITAIPFLVLPDTVQHSQRNCDDAQDQGTNIDAVPERVVWTRKGGVSIRAVRLSLEGS